MRSRLPKWGLTVLTMASVATVVLLVTGWGSAVAAPIASVFVANTSSNPVPVQQQGTADVNVTNTTPLPVHDTNTDASGNLKVHEQGTANVNVTNTTALPVQETNTDANGNIKVAQQGTASVNVTNTTLPVQEQGTVMTQQAIPASAFSLVGYAGDGLCPGPTSAGTDPGGFPAGTEVYITSFGQISSSLDPISGGLDWYQQSWDGNIVSNDTGKGLPISTSTAGTFEETFPQPFRLISGDHQCLKFAGSGQFFVTGYFG